MEPEKSGISRRKVNKKTFKQKPSGKDIAKGFWVSFKTIIKTCIVVLLVAGCILGGLLIGVVAGCIITTEPLTAEDLDITNSTALTSFIYDSKGNELVSIQGTANEKRKTNSGSVYELPDVCAWYCVCLCGWYTDGRICCNRQQCDSNRQQCSAEQSGTSP